MNKDEFLRTSRSSWGKRCADLCCSTQRCTTWGLFRWNQELLSLRKPKTHQPTCPQHGQAEQPTDICWIRNDLSSYCFKLKARNLSRIRESLEKIRNGKISATSARSLWDWLWNFFQLKFLAECHMHARHTVRPRGQDGEAGQIHSWEVTCQVTVVQEAMPGEML